MKVRIGVGLIPTADPHQGVGAGLAELVDDLESLGIDSVWLSDQVSSPEHADPLIGLAYAAGRTEKLKLGTGVLVLPGRNPALVAAQLAALAAVAPGRVLPAFGVQAATRADRTMYPAAAGRRGEVFEEAIRVVRALLTEPVVTHHGEFFHLQEASVGPLPPKPLDLWLGGRLPVSMDRIGRLADGWLGSFITPAEAQRCREQVEAAAAHAGRAVEADHYGTNVIVAPDGTDDAVIDALVARAAGLRTDLTDPSVLICRGWESARTQIREFIDVGLTKFVVRPIAPVSSRRAFLEQFAHELLPLEERP